MLARMRKLLKSLPLTILLILILSAVGCDIDFPGGEAGDGKTIVDKIEADIERARAKCEDTPPIGVFTPSSNIGECVYPDPAG